MEITEIAVKLLLCLLLGAAIGHLHASYIAAARAREDIARLKEPRQTQGEDHALQGVYHVPFRRRRRRRC